MNVDSLFSIITLHKFFQDSQSPCLAAAAPQAHSMQKALYLQVKTDEDFAMEGIQILGLRQNNPDSGSEVASAVSGITPATCCRYEKFAMDGKFFILAPIGKAGRQAGCDRREQWRAKARNLGKRGTCQKTKTRLEQRNLKFKKKRAPSLRLLDMSGIQYY